MGIKKTKIDIYDIPNNAKVTFKKCGNVIEICNIAKRNSRPTIKLLENGKYFVYSTKEVRECSYINNRAENTTSLRQSMRKLRDIINTNVTKANEWKWITLTYKNNMRDSVQLELDFKNFIRKARRKYKGYTLNHIACIEPQGRGAWHIHLLLSFGKVAPFIPNADIEKLWGKGFTSTKSVEDKIDNIGAYLTAYLGDVELTEDNIEELRKKNIDLSRYEIKTITEIEGKKLGIPKKYIKGARLEMYPPNFNLYRCSKGIRRPKAETMSYIQAKSYIKKMGILEPTYETAFKIEDKSNNFENLIQYQYYNIKRPKIQNTTTTPTQTIKEKPKERTYDKLQEDFTRFRDSSQCQKNNLFRVRLQV